VDRNFRPVLRDYFALLNDPQSLGRRVSRLQNESVGEFPRTKGAIRIVPPVCKRFRRSREAGSAKYIEHPRTCESHQNYVAPPSRHTRGDALCHFCFSCSLIVESAVSFEMRDAAADLRCYCGKPRDLLENDIRDCNFCQVKLAPAKASTIRVTGVCSNRQMSPHSLLDGSFHCQFVAGVAAASDIHRRQKRHERFLSAILDGLGRFTHIAIQVDGFHS
jgi:hypothetical protein